MANMKAASLRMRLYEAYASNHAGRTCEVNCGRIYSRDIQPMLPSPDIGPVLDIGCGQGELVRLLLQDGYDAEGVDISPEQVSIANAAGVTRVWEANYHDYLISRASCYAAVTATDLLEHLTKSEVLATYDAVAAALIPGGVFIARVPNGVSPFGGHIQYGDFTHESVFTARAIKQIAAAAGYVSVNAIACPPAAHGALSAARAAVWKSVSACYRLALAAETGTFRGHIVTQNLTFAARTAN